MLPWSAILHAGVGVAPHHVIDGLHYICHLLDKKTEAGGQQRQVLLKHASLNVGVKVFRYFSGDAAVLVEVVQVEGPVEFVSDGASQDDGQTDSKVLGWGEQN